MDVGSLVPEAKPRPGTHDVIIEGIPSTAGTATYTLSSAQTLRPTTIFVWYVMGPTPAKWFPALEFLLPNGDRFATAPGALTTTTNTVDVFVTWSPAAQPVILNGSVAAPLILWESATLPSLVLPPQSQIKLFAVDQAGEATATNFTIKEWQISAEDLGAQGVTLVVPNSPVRAR